MITSTTRSYAILLLILGAAAVSSHAAPASSTSFSTSPSNTSLGLPDRDVVRDPFGSYAGASGLFIAPQGLTIVGPNLALGTGFPSSLLLGGGGGGGGAGGSAGFPGASGGLLGS